MKWRAICFILAGTLASLGGVAFAATSPAGAADGGTSIAMIAVLAFSGLSQLGSTGYLIKMYAGKIDAQGKAIPELVATLQIHKAAMEAHTENEKRVLDEHAASIRELYGSRNAHAIELAEYDALHDRNGCRLPRRGGNP